MARPLRIEYPGAVYHITSQGNEKKPVYRDDQDRENFLSTLDKVNKRYNWFCHALKSLRWNRPTVYTSPVYLQIPFQPIQSLHNILH